MIDPIQNNSSSSPSRRDFLGTSGKALGLATAGSLFPLGLPNVLAAKTETKPTPENLVKQLYESFSDKQKETVCFGWDYTDKRGLLRTRVAANWNITNVQHNVISDFYTKDQQEMIESIFFGLYQPSWHKKIKTQLDDDSGGYGEDQTIAIFGKPGTEKFEFVMTGRHSTVRCDGNSADHVAFGGPIFYGHAADDFNEGKDHKGNVFWSQALVANDLYKMLDGKQRKMALAPKAPRESRVAFQGAKGNFSGIPISELTKDQQAHAQKVLQALIEPYRGADQEEALACLKQQGGLEKCHLTFYQANDIGNDGVWDNWRLEGPSFVWHYRGAPHVHVWANVANSPNVKLNAR